VRAPPPTPPTGANGASGALSAAEGGKRGAESRSAALRALAATDHSASFDVEAQGAGPSGPAPAGLARSPKEQRAPPGSTTLAPVDLPLTWGISVIGSGEIRVIVLTDVAGHLELDRDELLEQLFRR